MRLATLEGECYIFLFALLIALATVISHLIIQNIHPLVLAFYTFGFSFLLIHIVNNKHTNVFVKKVMRSWPLVLAINLSTAIDWLLIFLVLAYINGTLVNCLVFGIAPIATFFLSLSTYVSRQLFLIDLISCIAILLVLLLLANFYYFNIVQVQSLTTTTLLLCIGLCTLSGIMTGVTAILAKKLSLRDFDVLSMVKSRFTLLIIFSYLGILYLKLVLVLSAKEYLDLFVLALMINLLPSYFLQKGIEKTSSLSAVIISASIPALTYLFQLIDHRYTFNITEMVLVILLCGAICLSTILQIKTKVNKAEVYEV